MKNNYIITINNLSDIEEYKKLGIEKFLVPLKNFSVGYPNTFLISEINFDCYIYINRIFDNEGIDELKEALNNLPSNIKGIVFDDLGVMQLIKDLDIEKILYLSHFNTNSLSVEIYLEYVDSVILSTDITKEEIKYIVDKFPNKLTLFSLGYVPVMYSRRKLLDNYKNYYDIACENPLVIDNTNHKFMVFENEYGTIFYYNNIFKGLSLLDLNAKYFFINSVFLTPSEIKKLLNGEDINKAIDDGFLNRETIFKLKGDIND